ncbi:MAG: class I SAM-dependent RNA methyltransferase [Candidatus Binataceae bacterium]|nr:class I SAM-dependent RNA methyltransferase [Candidatus Binataceae bacterium]
MPTVEIEDLTLGRYGVGRIDGRAVMVPNAAPGDVLEVAIESERRNYSLARIEGIVRAGSDRRVPPCAFVPRCGGCDWQQLSYPAQVAHKARLIAAEFAHNLGAELPIDGLIEPAPAEFGYRSRVRFKLGDNGAVGFHEAASNRIVEIDRCLVAAPAIELPKLIAAAFGRRCREIEVAVGGAVQSVVVHLASSPTTADTNRAQRLIDEIPALSGIVIRDGKARAVIGHPSLPIELEPGLTIEVEPDLFTQVNHAENRKLVAAVMGTAAIDTGGEILDLYCGAGNFSLPAARRGARVIGVDYDPFAIETARRNAARLGLSEVQFLAMNAGEIARFLSRARYRPEVVIIDPPRAGAADLIDLIVKLKASRVIYVSCNVATLMRDLKELSRTGFKLGIVRAFDFFPNTHHAEVMAEMLLT